MDDKSNMEVMSSLLKIISDKTRLQMLAYLKSGEMCVCEFVDLFDLSQPAISQHLKKLRTADVILDRKQGTWVYYRLNADLPVYLSGIIQTLPVLKNKACDCQKDKKSIQLELSK